ncbi:hypothetical protein [Peristeroidobacter soli]|jgi:hypothetical protein|uniref:hypothetical protein n=1 Tax=Peristeroidobacter soli TaxID=2497877 RepID=UPI00101BE131|nr:hypothetical protein [Peristeroidobacter soli]
MNESRRHALQGMSMLLAAAACAGCSPEATPAAAAGNPSEGVPPPTAANPSAEPKIDEATLDFWTKSVREPAELYAAGMEPMSAAIANPEFLFYHPEKGFLMASDPEAGALPDKGNLQAMLRVERFRPAAKDRTDLGNLQQGSLRIDLQQTQPMPGLAEALAWSAVAAFLPETGGKLPALKNLEFNPGTAWGNLQTVPIPEGLGFWSWNFFVQRKESNWSRFFSFLRESAQVAVPFLGLPAIAVSALQQVDKLVGYLQSTDRTQWLLQSTAIPVFGTKAAADKVGSSGVGLRTGRYLVVPTDQVGKIADVASKAMLTREGLVVPKGTNPLKVFEAAEQFLPEVRYLSVYVKADVS